MADATFSLLLERVEKDHYAVMPDFFTPQQIAQWRDDALVCYQQKLFRPAGVGRADTLLHDITIRGDQIYWLEPEQAVSEKSTAAQSAYFEFLEQLRLQLNAHFMLGLFSAECHYTHYVRGSFYKKHLDRHKHSNDRVISVITYLNDQWLEDDGGSLRLYVANDQIVDVAPRAGTLVCFLSDAIAHEVLPVNKERISLTAWLRIRPDSIC